METLQHAITPEILSEFGLNTETLNDRQALIDWLRQNDHNGSFCDGTRHQHNIVAGCDGSSCTSDLCETCDGEGSIYREGAYPLQCHACNGNGEIERHTGALTLPEAQGIVLAIIDAHLEEV